MSIEATKQSFVNFLSLCSPELAQNIARLKGEAAASREPEHPLFSRWRETVSRLGPVLQEGGSLSVFISHAWHVDSRQRQGASYAVLAEAGYYDQLCIEIGAMLKLAGFTVLLDRDPTITQGIAMQGTQEFMKKIDEVDVVLGLCTDLYQERSIIPSGVKIEVDRIVARAQQSGLGFYLPFLVHARDTNFSPDCLLVGEGAMRHSSLWLDLRDHSTFI